jgi:hypothetical protein
MSYYGQDLKFTRAICFVDGHHIEKCQSIALSNGGLEKNVPNGWNKIANLLFKTFLRIRITILGIFPRPDKLGH